MHSDHGSLFLLISALGAIIALVVLIGRFKLNPFVVLLSVSVALALVTGMPVAAIAKSFETGVGGTLGHIAIIVALGTMLGKMMAESGGSDRIAGTLIELFGEKRVPWAMVTIGLLVGLPVFFEVGFVLLVPIAFNVARRTGMSMVAVGIPMVVGLSVVHGSDHGSQRVQRGHWPHRVVRLTGRHSYSNDCRTSVRQVDRAAYSTCR
jgi:GntP family gluconate:H+ symporter